MGLFTRLKMGLVLTKDSLLVIRHNPRLGLFPAISAIAGLVFLVLFLGITFGLAQIQPEGGIIIGLFLVYLGLTFISSFFSAALVHQTREIFEGNELSLRDGMHAAWEMKAPIFVWSVIAATVGVLINMLESSDSLVARILGSLFGLAWTILTFFVIPVIVFERTSITEMFKRSGGLFKDTWGETPISLVAINVIGFLAVLPFAALGFGLVMVGGTPLAFLGVGVILIGVLCAFLLSQTLQGVVKTSLYVYATEGQTPEEFSNVNFDELPADQDQRSRGGPVGPRSGGFQ